jgi:tRNA(Ile)-lysidine synthase
MKMKFRLKVLSFIEEYKLFDKKNKLILGLSGGADSMALAHFLNSEGYQFIAAHCNFQLRDSASDKDQELVENWCNKNGIKCFIKSFNTNKYAKTNKLSIEMAARKLRYDWFKELVKGNNAEGIVVAHHLNDQIETYFLNMLRGSGIKGYKGMIPKNGNVLRPFLEIKREEIEKYVLENSIPYRIDETNADTAIVRNAIRHKIVPELEKLNPSFNETMKGNMRRFAGVWSFLEIHFKEMEEQFVKKNRSITKIQLPNKNQSHIYPDFLNYLFDKENFSFPMTELQSIINGQVGKFLEYKGYRLTKERGYLSISQNINKCEFDLSINKVPHIAEWDNYIFHFKYIKPEGKNAIPINPEVVWLHLSETHLPLTIRAWQPGDSMKPYGISGTKKIKKMLTDAHVPSTQRKNYPVVCAKEEIVWLPLIRPNMKYIVSGKEEQVLEIRITQKESE